MSLKVHYEADPTLLRQHKVAIIGYGSQGHAHALNLKDDGVDVIVGLRASSASCDVARKHGLEVVSVSVAVRRSTVVMLLVPDQSQKAVYEEHIRDHLQPGDSLGFGHGFNIHYGRIAAPAGVNVFMVAPKSPGHLVRRTFEEGKGVPCLVAVHQDATGSTLDLALSYAHGIGGTRAGVIETSFKDETETDLFGEQAVLCGGAEALIKAGYETLVEGGYPEELAYFEVLHELKLIVDLCYEGGLSSMNNSISDTAEYGNYSRGPRVIGPEVKREMKRVLTEIQSGQFADEWIKECEEGWPNMDRFRRESATHPIEQVGGKLRSMMSWIRSGLDSSGKKKPTTSSVKEQQVEMV